MSPPELVELIRNLAGEFSDDQIARILRCKRLKTPKGLSFNAYHVANVRSKYGIPKGPRVPVRGEDVYTAKEAAELLEIDPLFLTDYPPYQQLPDSEHGP